MWVHGQRDELAPRQVSRHPLHLVRVDVRGGTFDGCWQVQDDLSVRSRLPDIHDGLADVEGELRFSVNEDLRRVLVAEHCLVTKNFLCCNHDLARSLNRERYGFFLAIAEDHVAEHW